VLTSSKGKPNTDISRNEGTGINSEHSRIVVSLQNHQSPSRFRMNLCILCEFLDLL